MTNLIQRRFSPKDWLEDAEQENGNYNCICHVCYEQFIGHKRRVTCRVCARKDEA